MVMNAMAWLDCQGVASICQGNQVAMKHFGSECREAKAKGSWEGLTGAGVWGASREHGGSVKVQGPQEGVREWGEA